MFKKEHVGKDFDFIDCELIGLWKVGVTYQNANAIWFYSVLVI